MEGSIEMHMLLEGIRVLEWGIFHEGPSGPAILSEMGVELSRLRGLVCETLFEEFRIVSVPFSSLGGNREIVYQKLVKDPADFTFKRPLGDF